MRDFYNASFLKVFFLIFLLSFWGCNFKKTEKKKERQKENIIIKNHKQDALKEAIIKNPNNPENYFLRAKIYREEGKNKMAIADLQRAISLDSLNAEYHFNLADIHYQIGNSDEAFNQFNKCLELNPKHTKSMLKLAKIYFVFRHYDDAFEWINSALKINEFIPEAYYLKGFIYKETGDTLKAISSFQTARELNPDFYDATFQIGLLYALDGNNLALDFYNDALRIDPQSIEVLYSKGIFFQEEHQFKKAQSCYQKIINIDSTYFPAYYNQGFINLVYLDNLDEAVNYFTKVIKLSPNHFNAYYNRGYAYELAGKKKLAEEDFRKALEINPDFDLPAQGLSRLGI